MGRFGGRVGLATALVVLGSPPAALAAPSITELAGLSAPAAGVTAGPDGAVWFTESDNPGRIGRTTAAGPPAEVATGGATPGFTANKEPALITAGPDGNLWFTETDPGGPGAAARITPAHAVTEFSAGLPANPNLFGIAAGPDGNLWLTSMAAPGRLLRIAPATGALTTVATGGATPGFSAGGLPVGIVTGADGNLWFTELMNPGRLGRVTPGGSVTEFTSGLTANRAPDQIALGPDGNLWFTEQDDPGAIGRITPAGAITEFAAGLTPNSIPTGIAAGPDGKLWFTEQGNPGRIGRIDPLTGEIAEYTSGLTPNSAPGPIAAGPDGRMWFTESAGPRLGRVTVGPGVTTGDATNIAGTGVTLTGSARPNGQATTIHFDYGTTTAYGSATPDVAAGSGTGTSPIAYPVAGLAAGTTYHYRLVGTNAADTTVGADRTFTTLGSSAGLTSPIPVTPGPAAPPARCSVTVARTQNGLLTRGSIRASVMCDKAVIAQLGGKLIDTPRVGRRARLRTAARRARTYHLVAPARPIAAGQRVTLLARLPKRAARKVRAGLRRRDRITASITLTATDEGQQTSITTAKTTRVTAKRKRKPRR